MESLKSVCLKGEKTNMKQIYNAPDFEISAYALDDVLTVSVGTGPVEGGNDGWMEI